MICFCTDLDNTLIYSYKYEMGPDKVLVEKKEGKELSFMSRQAYGLLQQISKVHMVVPITTRSLEQYLRIQFGTSIPIRYALVANGGILLKDGKIEKQWLRKTKRLIKSAEEELRYAMELLRKETEGFFDPRLVDGLFVFGKSEDSQQTVDMLRMKLDLAQVTIASNRSKVYVLPKCLDKGTSLRRFRTYQAGRYEQYVAAGDSEFDVPMLEQADLAYSPQELQAAFKNTVIQYPQVSFTENMLQDMTRRFLIQESKNEGENPL